MRIVIDIDDKLYNRIKYLEPKANAMLDELMRSVQNGTPLPKGYGRLIDVKWLERNTPQHWDDVYGDPCVLWDEIYKAPTIIEADKAESEEV